MSTPVSIRFIEDSSLEPAVRGFLHLPAETNGDGLILTHGAGANCQSNLLVAMANAFVAAGFCVLRCDLPFRQRRPKGPPFGGNAAADREGLGNAVRVLRDAASGPICRRVYLGGHSYGGRQASMLAADEKDLVSGLLLLSYPLHPPRRPLEMRTAHFPKLATPALFVHGSRDPFGSIDELRLATGLISASSQLLEISGSGHELLPRGANGDLPTRVVEAFREFFA